MTAAPGPPSKPLHVMLLIDELDEWRGTETHLFRLVQKLDPTRVRVTVGIVGRHGLQPDFEATGAQVLALGIERVLHPRGVMGAIRIRDLLRRLGVGLLVTYHTGADLLGPVAGRLAGVPVISCRRDDGFTKKPIHVKCQRILNRGLAGMISVSHAVTKAVEHTEGFPRSRNRVIWNGEDLETFAPARDVAEREAARAALGLEPEDVGIVSVGGLVPVKDPMCQVRAMRRLAGRCPQARLLLVGDGSERATLEAKISEAGLGERIRLLGRRRDVPAILRGADIYTQTSHTEGFSNAILQAMACGLPVVATAVGGNVEFVSDGCGCLVPKEDDSALAKAMEGLVVEPGRRQAMGQAARAHAENHGSLATMTEAYMQAFEEAASGSLKT